MKHLDLFSGIGGFALATEMAFPNERIEHIFCDNDPFSQAILKKHWPSSLIYDDIKTLTASRIVADTDAQRQLQPQGGEQEIGGRAGDRIDLLTGGFPCQPFSSAGRRAGTEDNRHLWPEMLRVIRETNPRFVLGENVGGLLTWDGGLVLEMVLSDLEEAGYEAGAFVIPACAVGAPHRRDRVWIAAHALGSDAGGASGQLLGAEEGERIPERDEVGESSEPSEVRNAPNAAPRRRRQGGAQRGRISSGEGALEKGEWRGSSDPRRDGQWREDWPTVAARLCTMDDGIPGGLARPRGWRNAALKGAGNAIVPQVAAEVIRAMMI